MIHVIYHANICKAYTCTAIQVFPQELEPIAVHLRALPQALSRPPLGPSPRMRSYDAR